MPHYSEGLSETKFWSTIARRFPLAYWMLDKWSQSFAYRAPFDALIFIIGGAAVTFIALTIIGLNVMKVAQENPVNALRSE